MDQIEKVWALSIDAFLQEFGLGPLISQNFIAHLSDLVTIRPSMTYDTALDTLRAAREQRRENHRLGVQHNRKIGWMPMDMEECMKSGCNSNASSR